MTEYRILTAGMVNLQISSNITSFVSEKKFDKSISVGDLKMKLEMITGGTAANMDIVAYNKEDKVICKLDDDSKMLGSYPLDDGHRLHVEDSTKLRGEFENVDKVEKFELSEQEYQQRDDTVAAYLKRNKLGKYNEEEMAALAKEKEEREAEERSRAESGGMVAGVRCEVTVPGQMKRRGTIRYAGTVHFQPGWWIGIEYDEPMGKNDGSVGGQRYFTCQDKYGGFVKPNTVEVGDFPEEDLDLSDGEM